jgi:hypothetical protein
MISTIEWIPAGVADPHPKKYELSSAEEELLTLMEEKGSLNDHIAHVEAAIKTNQKNAPTTKSGAAENALPADLRMDEYSSDEEELDEDLGEGAVNDDENDDGDDNAMVGQVLGTSASSVVGDLMDDNDSEGKGPDKDLVQDGRGIDGDSDEDDEDLDDIPDTREFEPIDVEGLEAMGLSHVGMGNEAAFMNGLDRNDEDDDSDADDVLITADDALIVVAKAEDVRISGSFCGGQVGASMSLALAHFLPLRDIGRRMCNSGLCIPRDIRVRSKERKSLCASRYSIAGLSLMSGAWASQSKRNNGQLLRRRYV